MNEINRLANVALLNQKYNDEEKVGRAIETMIWIIITFIALISGPGGWLMLWVVYKPLGYGAAYNLRRMSAEERDQYWTKLWSDPYYHYVDLDGSVHQANFIGGDYDAVWERAKKDGRTLDKFKAQH